MENNKFRILVILLIVSIGMNFFAFSRISTLDSNIRSLSGAHRNEYNHLSSQINNLNHNLTLLREAEKWITTEEFYPDVENSSPENIILGIAWSFRELERGADIFLEYSTNGREWTEVGAEKTSGTSFTATLNLDPKENYKYRITATGNMRKSSDEKNIPNYYYQPRPARTGSISHGSNRELSLSYYGIELVQDEPLFDFFEVKEAYLDILYLDGDIESIEFTEGQLGERRMNHEEKSATSRTSRVTGAVGYDSSYSREMKILSVDKDFKKEVDSISLRVYYRDGTVHEGELFPNETFHLNTHQY